MFKLSIAVFVLILASAGAASAGPVSQSCGSDTVSQAICSVDAALNGPGGIIPFTNDKVNTAWGIVQDVLP